MPVHVVQLAFLICAVIHVFFLSMSEGAFISSNGPCPHGYKEGDTWSAGIRCGGCTCYADSWNCVTCTTVELRINCYVISSPNGSFPSCCPKVFCKEDHNFDLFG